MSKKKIKNLRSIRQPPSRIFYLTGVAAGLLLLNTAAFANPQGGQVVGGSATISTPSSTSMHINQTSDKAIINWQSYNIGKQEHVHYQQPNASSISLNRINPANGASEIYGKLTANGQVWLVNPAGIYFGPSAYVNVGGLLATTANIDDADFMAGKFNFVNGGLYNGSIINEGTIIAAKHGLVALVGSNVTNNGLIEANFGTVILASGEAYAINYGGNDLISFAITKPVKKGSVTNNGTLRANGGKIMVSVASAGATLDNAINMNGIAVANSVRSHKGEIILSAGGGKVSVSGTIRTAGKHKGTKGGNIKITGTEIAIKDKAVIDASGYMGGGNILIGGNAYGIGPELNAARTIVGPDVKISADATVSGNGGKIVLWSNDYTEFAGLITARGGLESGNGGWIETSSHQLLNVAGGRVDTTAANGLTGTWLLDPSNIYIAANYTNAIAAGMTGIDVSANTISGGSFQATGSVQDSLLTTSNLISALGSTNVIVTTTNASGTGIGNINVVDAITWSSGNTLTLTAANNIYLNAAITTGTSSSKLILNAAGNVTQTAAIGGSGGLTQQGSGTTTLSQANTYTGATIVNAGVLNVTNTNGLGSASGSSITVNAGTLSLNFNGALANTSPLILNGSGTGGIGNSALYNAATSGTATVSNLISLGSATSIGANTGSTLALTSTGTI